MLIAPGLILIVLGGFLALQHDAPRVAGILLVLAGAIFIGLSLRRRPPSA